MKLEVRSQKCSANGRRQPWDNDPNYVRKQSASPDEIGNNSKPSDRANEYLENSLHYLSYIAYYFAILTCFFQVLSHFVHRSHIAMKVAILKLIFVTVLRMGTKSKHRQREYLYAMNHVQYKQNNQLTQK